jgi:hypothetical protein
MLRPIGRGSTAGALAAAATLVLRTRRSEPSRLFPPTVTNTQIEERKIYNACMYGQGNGGHAFTSVLTDSERLAVIEYMKTL